MTHKQFKIANSLILSVLATMLFLMLLLMAVGCVSEREVVYKKIYFADTNGVTTIYYQIPNDDARWMYVASKDAPDDGVAKEMKLLPIDLSMDNPHPYILNQEQWAEGYHKEHPECSYGYYQNR